jgi:predicted dithiol-disulfide oxidoreductase (DUF899 family)
MNGIRFPGESAGYRAARDELLEAEKDLRRDVERVAAMRRALPLGGEPPEDYVFDGAAGPVRLSELFDDGKDSLIVYSYMFGPQMKQPCVMCTSILDALDGEAPHVVQRVNLAVVAKSPLERILGFTQPRGWHNLRLLSSANNSYNRDYHAENEQGAQMPIANVFVRRGGKVRHFYATELLYAPSEAGQDGRHVDMFWPLWNLLDLTPEGRGTDWYPRLAY